MVSTTVSILSKASTSGEEAELEQLCDEEIFRDDNTSKENKCEYQQSKSDA